MIILFNEQPVSEEVKILKIIERAKSLYGSDYFDLENSYWIGDNLTIEALFPNWIVEEYEKNPSNVLVVTIIKNYLRWLFSIEYGYGAQLDWENIRDSTKVNSIFLEAYTDFYFYGADFSTDSLKDVISNIRKFLINADLNYFSQKGTPQSIRYLISNLFGFAVEDVDVYTANTGIMQINVSSEKYNTLQSYKSFLEEHVFPAGISIIYGVK